MKRIQDLFGNTTLGGREKPTPNDMWKQTKPRMRVMLGVAAYSLLLVMAYALRPDNPISDFWREIGIAPSFVALVLALSAVGGAISYYWFRAFWSILLSLSGLLFFQFLIIWQAATDEAFPLYDVILSIGVIVLFGIWMISAVEEEALDEANKKITSQNAALEAEINNRSMEHVNNSRKNGE